jgi:hypothetical protein
MRPLVLIQSRGETPTARLLRALGVVFTPHSFAEALAESQQGSAEESSLIISEDELASAATTWESKALRELTSRYRSVLLYPFRGDPPGLRALRECVDGNVEIIPLGHGEHSTYSVRSDVPSTGPFAGLHVAKLNTEPDYGLVIRDSPYPINKIVSVNDAGFLTRITLPSNELFVISSPTVFDVEAEMLTNLDARRCFSGLVPLIFFLRHAEAAMWRTPYHAANVIIDDLNLRPTYGFVNTEKLAHHVDDLRYAVSVAFIPWNCNRTSPKVAELFRRHWPQLSVCVHGCDHVGAEFATASLSTSIPMIALSLDRMRQLKAKTGLAFDRVMVFPQGKFSGHSMAAFRQSQFLAAVNTELVDDRSRRGVRAAELLAPAIASHGGFPLFLRRKAIEPIANFALDLLLGKPCFVVTHHDDFQRGMQPLGSLVESLNGLSPALHWTNLEEIVSRTYSSRPLSTTSSDTEVRLYASMTTLEPQSDHGEISCSKREPLKDKDFEVLIDGERVKSRREQEDIKFRMTRLPAERTVAEIRMSPAALPTLPARPLSYRTRVTARRYLSEIRDNYLSRSPLATAVVRSTRQILKRSARVRVP